MYIYIYIELNFTRAVLYAAKYHSNVQEYAIISMPHFSPSSSLNIYVYACVYVRARNRKSAPVLLLLDLEISCV